MPDPVPLIENLRRFPSASPSLFLLSIHGRLRLAMLVTRDIHDNSEDRIELASLSNDADY